MFAVVIDYGMLTLVACAAFALAWVVARHWVDRRSAASNLSASIPTNGSLAPRPQHAAFAHATLRAMAAEDAEAMVIALAAPGAEDFLQDVWEAVGRETRPGGQDGGLSSTGLEAIPARLAGRPAGLVKMPPPHAATEAYFVGIVLNHELGEPSKPAPEPEFYYFVLEKSASGGGAGRTVFARWDDGIHKELGEGPVPDARAFLDRIAEHLAALRKGARRSSGVRPGTRDVPDPSAD